MNSQGYDEIFNHVGIVFKLVTNKEVCGWKTAVLDISKHGKTP